MIPTAEEFLDTEEYYKVCNNYETRTALIEFAKLHVQEALKQASERKTYGILVVPLNFKFLYK